MTGLTTSSTRVRFSTVPTFLESIVNKKIAALSLSLASLSAFLVYTAAHGGCPSGSTCTCVTTQYDTCSDTGGVPPDCAYCRGIFQPCWDTYCTWQDARCYTNPGTGVCTETLVSLAVSQHRTCACTWTNDWFTCLGQPTCASAGYNSVTSGSGRYSCSVSQGS